MYLSLPGGPHVNGNLLGQLLAKRIKLTATTLRSRSDEVCVFYFLFNTLFCISMSMLHRLLHKSKTLVFHIKLFYIF